MNRSPKKTAFSDPQPDSIWFAHDLFSVYRRYLTDDTWVTCPANGGNATSGTYYVWPDNDGAFVLNGSGSFWRPDGDTPYRWRKGQGPLGGSTPCFDRMIQHADTLVAWCDRVAAR